jgi:hypothetical protein
VTVERPTRLLGRSRRAWAFRRTCRAHALLLECAVRLGQEPGLHLGTALEP